MFKPTLASFIWREREGTRGGRREVRAKELVERIGYTFHLTVDHSKTNFIDLIQLSSRRLKT